MASERRLHHRGEARPGRQLAVRWRTIGEPSWHAAHTRDIGVGGAFLLAVDLPIETRLTLELPLRPDAAPLVLTAEVRWTAPEGVGLQFLDVDIDLLLELNTVLAAMTTDEPTTR